MQESSYISINTFIPLEGKIDDFISLQLEETDRLRHEAGQHGWLENSIYKAQDGTRVVILTHFKDENAAKQWWRQSVFQQHLDNIRPLLESVDTLPVQLVARNSYDMGEK